MFKKPSNRILKNFTFSAVLFVFFTTAIFSQQQQMPNPMQQSPEPVEYSDSELKLFIQAANQVMPLQQESQVKMIHEVEEQDLTVDDFNAIMQAQSTGEGVADISEEDMNSFSKAIEGIEKVQVEYQTIITDAIEEEGMSVQKYEEIIAQYQVDQQLQMRINILMEEYLEEMEQDQ